MDKYLTSLLYHEGTEHRKMKIAGSIYLGEVLGCFGRCPEFIPARIDDVEVKCKEEIEKPGHKLKYIPRVLNEKGIDQRITKNLSYN